MIGKTLSHFKITAKLGEGGMGEVYLAEDTKLGREVAIKVLPEAVAEDPERLARFEREAKVLAALNHANIAAIYSLESAEPQPSATSSQPEALTPYGPNALQPSPIAFLVMELVEGEDLAERIARGPIPLAEALPMALQIAEGLEAAHEKGIIHRDLKPANVKVTESGEVKVLDFGLAKALALDPASGSLDLSLSPTLTAQMTGVGVLLGTAAYMAPEQARGKSVDKRADLWAFGCVLFEMITGRRTFDGETVTDIIASLVAREPEWEALPTDTPRPVQRLLHRCLDKDPRQRLHDAGDARLELQEAISGTLEPSGPDPLTQVSSTVAAAPRQPAWIRFLPWALAGLLAVALIAVWLLQPRPEKLVSRLSVALSEGALHEALGSSVVLSPDGRKLAYVVLTGERARTLYLRSLERLEPIAIATGEDNMAPYHPFFSPDSQWLGFAIPGELKKVPVTGGTPMTICKVRGSRGATWGGDGTIVLAPEALTGLVTVPDTGGETQPLTTLDEEGEISHRWPQLLPGGKAVVFAVGTREMNSADEAEIWAVTLASGDRKKVLDGGSYPRYVGTGHLLFVREGTIFAIRFDPERLEVSGSAAPVLEGVSTASGPGGAQYDVSEEGTLIYVTGGRGIPTYPVVWVDRDGSTSPLWSEPGAYGVPRLSPDAKRLSLSVLRDDNWDVWVYDLEREVSTRLTFDDGYDADQIFTPDGKSIVFTSDRGGTGGQIYRLPADGSGEAELLAEAETELWAESYTADGQWLAVETRTESFDILVLRMDGSSELEPFLASEFSERFPAFSPDGRWIAYQSFESGQAEIYVRPFPSAGGKWQISIEGGFWPTWSADGSELYYSTRDGLMVVPVDGKADTFRAGKAEPLITGSFRGNGQGISVGGYLFSSYDVAPDGRFVMFPGEEESTGQTHATIVFNWLEDLQQSLAGR